jgi:hypothetical protein
MADGDKRTLSVRTGVVHDTPLTASELQERASRAQDEADRQAQEAIGEQQRRDDLNSLKTAPADQIGRIIERLLRG